MLETRPANGSSARHRLKEIRIRLKENDTKYEILIIKSNSEGGIFMALSRIAIALALCLAVTFSGGCEPKLYSIDFGIEQDLGNSQGEWLTTIPGPYEFAPEGLLPKANMICCPLTFKGDFTMTMKVLVYASMGNPTLYLIFAENPVYVLDISHTQMLLLGFYGIGSADEAFMVVDRSDEGSTGFPPVLLIPGINRGGENILTIRRKGNLVSIKCNGTSVYDHTIQYFDSSWFAPHIYATSPGDSLIIGRVEVEYFTARDSI